MLETGDMVLVAAPESAIAASRIAASRTATPATIATLATPSTAGSTAASRSALDAGVANPQRSDGLSFLDVLWARAPFASQSAFQQAVTSVAARFVQAGLLTTSHQQKVVNAASAPHLAP